MSLQHYRDELNLLETRRCDGNTHVLRCCHIVTLNTQLCSSKCKRPQAGLWLRDPPACPICAVKADEDRLIQGLETIRFLQESLTAARNRYVNPVSTELTEQTEDAVYLVEMDLEYKVSRELWTLYIREGLDEIKRRRAARYQEEKEDLQERYIAVMAPEWRRENARQEEINQIELRGHLFRGDVDAIETWIGQTTDLIRRYEQNLAIGLGDGAELEELEEQEVELSFFRQRLRNLEAALVVAEAAAATA